MLAYCRQVRIIFTTLSNKLHFWDQTFLDVVERLELIIFIGKTILLKVWLAVLNITWMETMDNTGMFLV